MNPDPTPTNIDLTRAVDLADAELRSRGIDVAAYDRTTTEGDDHFVVGYTVKPPTPPGGFLEVRVEKASGQTTVFHGE